MKTFSFGKNWQDFLQTVTEERLNEAVSSLKEFSNLSTLEGKAFLDMGCGSGIFSYAAYQMKARKIISIDVDPFSVECCKHIRSKAENPEHWEVTEGSVLDDKAMSSLGQFDWVYAWGSLHHTGDMWHAIDNAAQRVAKGGLFQIAIYNNVKQRWGSNFWLQMKKFYNSSPGLIKRLVEFVYMSKLIAYYIINGRNPVTEVKKFKKKRGMSWRHDVIDWLGGYPYEYATVEEIFNFMKKNFPHFVLINIKTTNGLGNNQFLFKNDEL